MVVAGSKARLATWTSTPSWRCLASSHHCSHCSCDTFSAKECRRMRKAPHSFKKTLVV